MPPLREPDEEMARPRIFHLVGGIFLGLLQRRMPVFCQGMAQMEQTVANRVSYRYRYDPDTGYRGPLPVWSADALRSGIIED